MVWKRNRNGARVREHWHRSSLVIDWKSSIAVRRCVAISWLTHGQGDRPPTFKPTPVVLGAILLALALWLSYHYRHDIEHLVLVVQSLGFYGVAIAVVAMAFMCIIPVPSEFLILINIEMYGVFWGSFYSWIGAVIGGVAAMYLTRWHFQPLYRRMLSEARQNQVDEWVRKRGTLGLLGLRFTPFPFHALNYIAGVLGIRFWPFLWTTAVGLIPFYIFIGGAALGVTHGVVPAIITGVVVVGVLLFMSLYAKNKWFKTDKPTLADDTSTAGR